MSGKAAKSEVSCYGVNQVLTRTIDEITQGLHGYYSNLYKASHGFTYVLHAFYTHVLHKYLAKAIETCLWVVHVTVTKNIVCEKRWRLRSRIASYVFKTRGIIFQAQCGTVVEYKSHQWKHTSNKFK